MKDKLSDGNVVLKIRNGRFGLPSGYKVTNGEILILTRNVLDPSSLVIYTRKQWIPIREHLLENGASNRGGKWQELTRYVLGNAEDCMVEAGEIRISSHLVKAADLHSEAIWIPGSDHVEIWNPRAFDEWKRNQEGARE